jgi:hypothetical protein
VALPALQRRRRHTLVAYFVGAAAADAIQTYGLYAGAGIVVVTVAVALGLRWWERRMLAKAE